MRSALIIGLAIFCGGTAAASEPAQIIGGSDVASMIVSLVIVIAAILAIGWLYSRSRFASSGQRGVINVVASRALGTKERLLIVEIDDQQLLLGMTPGAISTLHVFDKPVATSEAEPAPNFAEKFNAILGKKTQ